MVPPCNYTQVFSQQIAMEKKKSFLGLHTINMPSKRVDFPMAKLEGELQNSPWIDSQQVSGRVVIDPIG